MSIIKVNLTDYDKMIYDFMVTVLQAKYPLLDVSPTSVCAEVFLNPMIEVIKPFITQMNYMDLLQDFENADLVDPDDLDRVYWNRYGVTRNPGTKALGEIILVFETIPTSGILKIPAGTTVSKSSDRTVKYTTTQEQAFTLDQLVEFYDENEFVYNVPVQFQAQEVGAKYNALAGEISTLETQLINVVQVKNAEAIINGKDPETNSEFAQRVKRFQFAKILSSEPGYIETVKENFSAVFDVYVAGYKNDFMNRDLDESEVHRGGMVDLYIYGQNPTNATEDLIVDGDGMIGPLSKKPFLEVSALHNLTQDIDIPYRNYEAIQEEEYEAGEWTIESKIVIYDSSLYDSSDVFSVEYKYWNGSQETAETENSLAIEGNEISLSNANVTEIVSLVNSTKSKTIPEYNFAIEYTDENLKNSVREECKIEILREDFYQNGDTITVQYKHDKLIEDIQEYYNINRDVCADVLAKKAVPLYFYIKCGILLEIGNLLNTVLKERLFNAANKYFSKIMLGGIVDESAFVSHLRNDPDVGPIITSIKIPVDGFYSLTEKSNRIINMHTSSAALSRIQYPVLYKFEVYEVQL
jgi:hypothetical protein